MDYLHLFNCAGYPFGNIDKHLYPHLYPHPHIMRFL